MQQSENECESEDLISTLKAFVQFEAGIKQRENECGSEDLISTGSILKSVSR